MWFSNSYNIFAHEIEPAQAPDAQAMQNDQAHKLSENICYFFHVFRPVNLESTLKAKCFSSCHHYVMCQLMLALLYTDKIEATQNFPIFV